MSLNIKNPRVHALAREASRRTGRTQTSVIEQALRRLLDELDKDESAEESRAARLHALLEQLRLEVTDEERAAMQEVEDSLYDEQGMPR